MTLKYTFVQDHIKKIRKKIFYNDYDEALNDQKFSFVYVSLINTLHYKYALKSLQKGFNVIIDKPITTKSSETLNLLKIAKRKKLFLCELTIFNYHIVYNKILKILGGKNKISLFKQILTCLEVKV